MSYCTLCCLKYEFILFYDSPCHLATEVKLKGRLSIQIDCITTALKRSLTYRLNARVDQNMVNYTIICCFFIILFYLSPILDIRIHNKREKNN